MIRKFYDLSTAHVSPAARHWLEATAYVNALQQGMRAYPVAAFMHGWMMWVPNAEHLDGEDVPFDLRDACVEARLCGCDYLLFDADAEIIGTLPVWKEDETSTEGFSEEEKAALAAIHPEDGMPLDDPGKPADRRVLLDDESPTFGRARRAAHAAGKAALAEDAPLESVVFDRNRQVIATGAEADALIDAQAAGKAALEEDRPMFRPITDKERKG